MQVAGSQARVSGTSVVAIHGLGQNPGNVEGERVIFEALLETNGDDVQLALDLYLNVALEGYELPLVPMLAVITDEVDVIVEWFAPALGPDDNS